MIQDAAAWIFGLIGGNQDRRKSYDFKIFGRNSMNVEIHGGTILKDPLKRFNEERRKNSSEGAFKNCINVRY